MPCLAPGALTLDGDSVKRLVAYYTTAHASKFVPPGSVRIGSQSDTGSLPHVAFRTPTGGHVLIVSNNTKADQEVRIRFLKRDTVAQLPSEAVATYVW